MVEATAVDRIERSLIQAALSPNPNLEPQTLSHDSRGHLCGQQPAHIGLGSSNGLEFPRSVVLHVENSCLFKWKPQMWLKWAIGHRSHRDHIQRDPQSTFSEAPASFESLNGLGFRVYDPPPYGPNAP